MGALPTSVSSVSRVAAGAAACSFPIHLIVPTRDSHRLLPRLVASLQAQTGGDWRVTCIDGGSGEEHRAWLEALCLGDGRFRWLGQNPQTPGIFGAMNQGFSLAAPNEWLLFWGSDDWAAGPQVLAQARTTLERCSLSGRLPDLLVCRGRYYTLPAGLPPSPSRTTAFRWRHSYRRSLLLGSTPPHQATLIGPGARVRVAHYAEGFRLSADLDYFLRLSTHADLEVCRSDLELVHMGDGGVSGQQTRRRLGEVRQAYRRCFGGVWPVPFLLRYGQKILSRFEPAPSRP
jgi:glycosyltransferase involved in cell wall biosynthesis